MSALHELLCEADRLAGKLAEVVEACGAELAGIISNVLGCDIVASAGWEEAGADCLVLRPAKPHPGFQWAEDKRPLDWVIEDALERAGLDLQHLVVDAPFGIWLTQDQYDEVVDALVRSLID